VELFIPKLGCMMWRAGSRESQAGSEPPKKFRKLSSPLKRLRLIVRRGMGDGRIFKPAPSRLEESIMTFVFFRP
jgi:hypothetical protein